MLAVSDEVDDRLLAGDRSRRSRDLDRVDLIVACGDLPFDYLAALMDASDAPLVFVPGNHDPDLGGYRRSRQGLLLRAGMPVPSPWPDGATNADGRVVDAAGLRLAGLGGCLRYSDGPNQYSQRHQTWRARRLAVAARWRRRRDGRRVDVVLTHAPPRGLGDGDDGPHRGFDGLHGLVAALDPLVLLHGHVHPYGRDHPDGILGRTVVCNVVGHRLLRLEAGVGMIEERGRHGP